MDGISVKLPPPSVLRHSCTFRHHTMSAFWGSAARVLKYQGRLRRFLLSVVRIQCMPLSSLRKMPPFSFSMEAYTRSGFAGVVHTVIFPSRPTGRPGYFDMSFHVTPPSWLLYKPLPAPPLL